jgi:hypothetical protein
MFCFYFYFIKNFFYVILFYLFYKFFYHLCFGHSPRSLPFDQAHGTQKGRVLPLPCSGNDAKH